MQEIIIHEAIRLCRGDGDRGPVRVAPADLEDFIRDHRSH
jgi:hypothetical protein